MQEAFKAEQEMDACEGILGKLGNYGANNY